jgi:hypothetical protein
MGQVILALGVFVVLGAILWRSKVRELPGRWRRWADGVEILVLAGLIGVVVVGAYRNITKPSGWDFPVFFTVARNALKGMSFYNPQALLQTFTEVQREANVPPDWLSEFGFSYAPPTALLLAPLGVFGYSMSLFVHYLVQGAFLGGSIVLLHRFYPLRPGAMGLAEMGILALAFRPVISAVGLAQIVFGALLFVVLAMWAARDHPWLAGLSLGVGAWFKLLLFIPAALSPAMRKSRVAAGAFLAAAAIAAVAGLTFGFGVYREFVTFGPSDRPAGLSLDPVIQSLNGFLRRVFDTVPSNPGAVASILYWPYLVVGGLLTAATVVIAWKVRRHTEATTLVFGFFIVLSLIVYPNTLYNTLPLVIPVLVVILFWISDLPFPRSVTVGFLAALGGVVAGTWDGGFVALILLWVFLATCLVSIAVRTPGPTAMTTRSSRP